MHKKKLIFILILLSAVMLFAGCQKMIYTIKPEQGVYTGKPNAAIVSTFKETMKAHYLFWGLAPVSKPDLVEVAKPFVQADQVMANVVIHEENNFLDGFLAAITYGIYRPRTVIITANIYNKAEVLNAQ